MSKLAPALLILLAAPSADAGEKPKARQLTKRPQVTRLHTARPVVRRLGKKAEQPCHGLEKMPATEGLPFKVGEELAYEVSVAGAYVGRFEIKIGAPRMVRGRKLIPLFGRARTSTFVSGFKSLEGRWMSLVDPETLQPVGVRVEGQYGGDQRWERIKFREDQRQVSADYMMRGKEKKRVYRGTHDLTDLLTMLYAARKVALTPGLKGCQDVFGARRLWRMDAEVKSLVDVQTRAGKKKAYKVLTKFDRRPTPGLSSKKRPSFELDVFLSEDRSHAPLQFVMRQAGLTAEAKLVKWTTSRTPAQSWD